MHPQNQVYTPCEHPRCPKLSPQKYTWAFTAHSRLKYTPEDAERALCAWRKFHHVHSDFVPRGLRMLTAHVQNWVYSKAQVYFRWLCFVQHGHAHGCIQRILDFVDTSVHKLNACALLLLDRCITAHSVSPVQSTHTVHADTKSGCCTDCPHGLCTWWNLCCACVLHAVCRSGPL